GRGSRWRMPAWFELPLSSPKARRWSMWLRNWASPDRRRAACGNVLLPRGCSMRVETVRIRPTIPPPRKWDGGMKHRSWWDAAWDSLGMMAANPRVRVGFYWDVSWDEVGKLGGDGLFTSGSSRRAGSTTPSVRRSSSGEDQVIANL